MAFIKRGRIQITFHSSTRDDCMTLLGLVNFAPFSVWIQYLSVPPRGWQGSPVQRITQMWWVGGLGGGDILFVVRTKSSILPACSFVLKRTKTFSPFHLTLLSFFIQFRGISCPIGLFSIHIVPICHWLHQLKRLTSKVLFELLATAVSLISTKKLSKHLNVPSRLVM